jgi:hypothetical protein
MAALFTSRSCKFSLYLCALGTLVVCSCTSSRIYVSSDQRHEDYCEFESGCEYVSGSSATCIQLPIIAAVGLRHGSLRITSWLHRTTILLSWIRPYHSYPFRQHSSRSLKAVFVAILLITGEDIELNPGPNIATQSTVRFGYINICSAINKSALIHNVIQDFSLDILALSETRFRADTPNAIKNDIAPAEFSVKHVFRQPTSCHPTGGGLAFVHRSDIVVKPHPLAATICPSSFELQLVRITSTKPSITVVNAYRPPSLSIATFYDELSDALTTISAATVDRLMVVGDLNCPGSDATSVSSRLEDTFDVFGLKQHVNSPTRSNPDHVLDVVATDPASMVCDIVVDDAGQISDHRLVVATITAESAQRHAPAVFTFRRIANIDLVAFEQKLRSSSLFLAPATTAEQFAEQMKTVIVSILDKAAPLCRRVRRPPKAITKFLSTDAIEAKRLRRRLERRWKTSHQEVDRIAYRRACRHANKLINLSRQDYFREQLSSATNLKDRWRTAKQILHSAKTVHSRTSEELDRVCNLFANYFVDKISKLKRAVVANLPSVANFSFPDSHYFGQPLASLQPVSSHEVYQLVTSMQTKTSSVDYIPTSLIKSCPTVFSEIICKLANLSFSEGVFPSMFKTAAVTPLLKKPGLDEDSPANYRPISNLNNISKLLERLFLARFQPHVVGSHNFNNLQSAYRPHHSTETALLLTLDSIYTAADKSQPTLLVSLDLSAAFDTIDHSVLLSRLNTSFGVCGATLAWLTSYLSGRSQVVRIGSSTSSTVTLDLGVPQGSVLGPILFSSFISPIGQITASFNISHQQYADDTQLYIPLSVKHSTPDTAQLESCLTALYSWFSHNGLCLNPTKSDSILFGTHQRLLHFPTIPHVDIAGTMVNLSDHITTLGVILDSKLTFDHHVTSVCKSSHFHLRALRHIRPVLTDDMAASITTALVQSRLDYANSLLYRTSTYNINKLQRIQNIAARLVLPHHHLPTAHILAQLHWLPVSHRINFKFATITYNTIHNNQPEYLRSLIRFDQPARVLRSAALHKLHVPSVNKAIGQKAFSSASPAIWNNIPLSIRQASSISSFKRLLKSHYFSSIL